MGMAAASARTPSSVGSGRRSPVGVGGAGASAAGWPSAERSARAGALADLRQDVGVDEGGSKIDIVGEHQGRRDIARGSSLPDREPWRLTSGAMDCTNQSQSSSCSPATWLK
jgi:hypothetical protein